MSPSDRPSTTTHSALVDVFELAPISGELAVPAVPEVSMALALFDYSARCQSPQAAVKEVRAGTVAICRFNESRRFEIRGPARFAVIQLRNEVLEEICRETRHRRIDLQAHDMLQDSTLRRFMKILHREKQNAFQSGALFLDSIATALASYLVRHYSVTSTRAENFSGGLAPSMLRRCVEFIETHLEGDLRLHKLAREAGISTSHFIRSFRQSTGTTPHQYLLGRRVERAKNVMRDRRASLTEVALASGFADQHHFARVFRSITGMTPSGYRRSL